MLLCNQCTCILENGLDMGHSNQIKVILILDIRVMALGFHDTSSHCRGHL